MTDRDHAAVIRGNTRLALGRAKDDNGTDGVEVDIGVGDVIVIPAGVSHRSLRSEGEFRYIGVYPKVSQQAKPVYRCGRKLTPHRRLHAGGTTIATAKSLWIHCLRKLGTFQYQNTTPCLGSMGR